jgi:hypothetical protein
MVQSQSGLSAGGSISLDSVVNQKDPQLQRSPAFLWVALKTLAATLEVKDPDRNSVGLLKNPAQVRRRSRDTRHDEKDACSYDRSRAAWDSPKAGSIVFLYTAIDTESTGTDEAGLEKSTVPSEDRTLRVRAVRYRIWVDCKGPSALRAGSPINLASFSSIFFI